MRYLIKFSYDGTNFNGYQKQPSCRCVESELENALYHINDYKPTKVVGAGRTDRGVHAICQCAHFDIIVDISLYKLKCALNSLLPPDIHVFAVQTVDASFHARYMVKSKIYRYILNCGEYNPLERNYVYQYCRSLDVEKMKIAIQDFVGIHDFKNFASAETVKDNYVREIFNVSIEEDDNKLIFTFVGTGFLKYQVRNMVGTLVKIGNGKLGVDCIQKIFSEDSLRKHVMTIKSEGLYLVDIQY